MQHLDEGTIHAWLDGALPQAEAASVERHVAECAQCSALAAAARGLIAGSSRIVSALDNVPMGVIPAKPAAASGSKSLWRQLRLTPARAAIAATLIVGVASMLVADRAKSVTPVKPIVAPSPPSGPTTQTAVAPLLVEANKPVIHREAPRVPVAPAAPAASAARVANVAPQKDSVASVTSTGQATSGIVASAMAPAAVAGIGRDSLPVQKATADVAARRSLVQNALTVTPSSSAEGCYQVSPDSARVVTGLPARFALERDSVGRMVVRTLTSQSQPDSALGNLSWNRVGSTVRVFEVADPQRHLTFTTGASSAAAFAPARSAGVTVQRTTCRP